MNISAVKRHTLRRYASEACVGGFFSNAFHTAFAYNVEIAEKVSVFKAD